MGGSLAAMAMFESGYKPDLELEEAKALVERAITAGIENDLGSGSNVDVCVITKDGTDYIRPRARPVKLTERAQEYRYKPGTTAVLTEKVQKLAPLASMVTVESMDVSS